MKQQETPITRCGYDYFINGKRCAYVDKLTRRIRNDDEQIIGIAGTDEETMATIKSYMGA